MAAVVVVLGVATGAGADRHDRADGSRGDQRERVIVALTDDAGEPRRVARDHGYRYGARVGGVYEHALRGYAAEMPASAARALAGDPRVAYVEVDQVVSTFADTVPTGVDRIQADGTTFTVGATGATIDVDIAIIDTGISPHADLNIAGGARCTSLLLLWASCRSGGYTDGHGHGTHVAGIAGARNDGIGVVGVAPGARLWAVKALDDNGSGFMSQIVAALDWVTARAGTIEVANMSLGAEGQSRALSDAITRSTNAGVVYVVAAGNSAIDAATTIPANHPRVIAVSAVADFDGQPGGRAEATCRADVDDTLADFSSYGSVVDLAAPGVCITSTWNDGGYNTISGTSMASPHAAGAAAAYVVALDVGRTSTRWSQVRSGLQSAWAVPQTSTCGFGGGQSSEPMLLLGDCTG